MLELQQKIKIRGRINIHVKRLFIFFLTIILFLNISIWNNDNTVSAITWTLDLGWEYVNEGVSNCTPSPGFMYTKWNYTTGKDFEVDTDQYKNGAKSFLIDADKNSCLLGWWNITFDFNYISSFNFWYRNEYPYNDPDRNGLRMFFYEDDVEVLRLFFASSDEVGYYDVDGDRNEVINSGQGTQWYKYTVTNTPGTNEMNYSLSNSAGAIVNSIIDSSRTITDWATFDRIEFYGDNTYTNIHTVHFDDFDVTSSGTTPANKTIYIDFYDRETNKFFTSYEAMGPYSAGTFNLEADISSDLNNDYGYSLGAQTVPITLEESFTNGDFHYINLSDITGFNYEEGTKAYYDFSTYIQLYNGQTYTFGLTPVGYSNPLYNYNCKLRSNLWLTIWYEACVATDKRYYTSGETVNCYYRMPTVSELSEIGVENTNWRVGVWNYDNVTAIGALLNIWDYTPDYSFYPLDYSGSMVSAGNWDPPAPTTGADDYIITIYNPTLTSPLGTVTFFIWDLWQMFTVVNGSFTPSGNITAISPTEPVLGQNVNISFNANNNGQITYKNLLGPDNSEKVLTYFTKFSGTAYANKRFYDYGTYQLKLYVSDGERLHNVDTDFFYINSSNATGPGEYLTVAPYYAIAGYDTIFITYKTEVDDTLIDVVDARGQTTPYGTTVDTGGATYSFDLPPGAAIGTWTVTMYGNDTLSANFSVIADENNFMRFHKNQYFENERFGLIINHDKKILIRFFKDGVAQGSDLIFEANQQPQGLYMVPTDIVNPSPGDWTAEMWEINHYVEIQLLAVDNCTVIEYIPTTPDIEGGYDNILSIIALGGEIFGGGSLGLMVMSLFILLIIIILTSQFVKNKNGKTDTSIVLFIGIIAALCLSVIGWLPWWITVLAIILVGLLFGEALSKKLNLGGG